MMHTLWRPICAGYYSHYCVNMDVCCPLVAKLNITTYCKYRLKAQVANITNVLSCPLLSVDAKRTHHAGTYSVMLKAVSCDTVKLTVTPNDGMLIFGGKSAGSGGKGIIISYSWTVWANKIYIYIWFPSIKCIILVKKLLWGTIPIIPCIFP